MNWALSADVAARAARLIMFRSFRVIKKCGGSSSLQPYEINQISEEFVAICDLGVVDH